MPTEARRPAKLGSAGASLWKQITETYELRADEVRMLEDACREADLVDRLHKALGDADLLIAGSQGQLVANPLVGELRQHRATLASLLKALKLPDGKPGAVDGAAKVAEQARAAARARWDRPRKTG